jgi:uncharacterized protein YwgA
MAMDINEIILFLISQLGGSISSKTKIQKLCYFYSILSGRKLGFIPHYYGPYSPQVATALDELEGIGLVDKKIENLGESSEGFEVKRYDYEINKYGSQVVERIKEGQDKEDLTGFVGQIQSVGDLSYFDLSIAAKAYFILKRENKNLTHDEISKKAKNFNWNINKPSIERAIKLLKKLELAT